MKTIKEFMDVIHMEVDEVIRFFTYGDIVKLDTNQDDNTRAQFLREDWVSSYDSKMGQCFTFDPYRSNVTLQSLTNIRIEFKVRHHFFLKKLKKVVCPLLKSVYLTRS